MVVERDAFSWPTTKIRNGNEDQVGLKMHVLLEFGVTPF